MQIDVSQVRLYVGIWHAYTLMQLLGALHSSMRMTEHSTVVKHLTSIVERMSGSPFLKDHSPHTDLGITAPSHTSRRSSIC